MLFGNMIDKKYEKKSLKDFSIIGYNIEIPKFLFKRKYVSFFKKHNVILFSYNRTIIDNISEEKLTRFINYVEAGNNIDFEEVVYFSEKLDSLLKKNFSYQDARKLEYCSQAIIDNFDSLKENFSVDYILSHEHNINSLLSNQSLYNKLSSSNCSKSVKETILDKNYLIFEDFSIDFIASNLEYMDRIGNLISEIDSNKLIYAINNSNDKDKLFQEIDYLKQKNKYSKMMIEIYLDGDITFEQAKAIHESSDRNVDDFMYNVRNKYFAEKQNENYITFIKKFLNYYNLNEQKLILSNILSTISLSELEILKEKYANSLSDDSKIFIELMEKIEKVETKEEFDKIVDGVIRSDFSKVEGNLIEETTLKEFRDKLFNPIDVVSNRTTINYQDTIIPVITIDDYPFDLLVSTIVPKVEQTNKHGTSILSRQIVSNPSMWLDMETKGNDKISTSHISESQFILWQADTNVSGVTVGFSNIDKGQVYSYAPCDNNTSMDIKEPHIAFPNYKTLFSINSVTDYVNATENGFLSNFNGYNEIRLNRYKKDENGNLKKYAPDYIVVTSDQMEVSSLEWAKYFNIPIVRFDKKKIFDKARLEYQQLLNSNGYREEVKDKHLYLLSIMSSFTYDDESRLYYNECINRCNNFYYNNNLQMADRMVEAMANGTLDVDGNFINNNSITFQGKTMGFGYLKLFGFISWIFSFLILTIVFLILS